MVDSVDIVKIAGELCERKAIRGIGDILAVHLVERRMYESQDIVQQLVVANHMQNSGRKNYFIDNGYGLKQVSAQEAYGLLSGHEHKGCYFISEYGIYGD